MLKASILVPSLAALFLSPALQGRAQVGGIQIGPARASTATVLPGHEAISPFPEMPYVAPIPHAPFTASIIGTHSGVEATGPTIRMGEMQFTGNNRLIARDSTGRIMLEQRAFVHNGEHQTTPLLSIDYIDPAQGKVLHCDAETKTCSLYALRTTKAGYLTYSEDEYPLLGMTPAQVGEIPFAKMKALGQKTLEGIVATGYRHNMQGGATGPPRLAGSAPTAKSDNEVYTSEIWYSPDLQLELKVRSSTTTSDHTDTLKNIQRAEPDPKLFQIPAGYQLVTGH